MTTYTTAKQTIEEIAAAIAPGAPEDLEEKDVRVREIVETVRRRGDEAICEYIQRFDSVTLTPAQLKVEAKEFHSARSHMEEAFEKALEQAARNIRRFHEKQFPQGWLNEEEAGNLTGEKFTPIDKVGIHIPGATAPLTSSVLMTVIPAQVAGVKEIHLATPPDRTGNINPAILATADFLGVHSVFKMAGAQAIAAFAFGTAVIPKVDKVVGPGNIYTTLAKRHVFGIVGIDGLYGPSEVVILADEKANPSWVAADLLAQAEHGPDSCAILISPSQALLEAVGKEVEVQLQALPRQSVAAEAWREKGARVQVKDIAEGLALSNLVAPEHMEIHVKNPRGLLEEVKNAGCILLGPYSPAAVSDYLAGPSHCLPTGRSAAFSSGLGVMDFMKRSDIVSISAATLAEYAKHIRQFTALEGLAGHSRAVEERLQDSAAEE